MCSSVASFVWYCSCAATDVLELDHVYLTVDDFREHDVHELLPKVDSLSELCEELADTLIGSWFRGPFGVPPAPAAHFRLPWQWRDLPLRCACSLGLGCWVVDSTSLPFFAAAELERKEEEYEEESSGLPN